MSYLPSKKVRVVALILLVILIGLFWYVGKTSQPKTSLVYVSPEQIAEQKHTKQLEELIAQTMAEKGALQQQVFDANPEPAYSTSSSKISNDNSPAALKAYGLSIVAIMQPLSNQQTNNAQLVLDILNTQDQTKVTQLENSAQVLGTVAQQMSLLVVPSKALAVHLAATNKLAILADLLGQMSLVLDEPDLALTASITYTTVLNDFYIAGYNLNQFFDDNKIEFTDAERGLTPAGTTN